MEELKMAKRELEQEVDTHKTRLRLHIEAQVLRIWFECQCLFLQVLYRIPVGGFTGMFCFCLVEPIYSAKQSVSDANFELTPNNHIYDLFSSYLT